MAFLALSSKFLKKIKKTAKTFPVSATHFYLTCEEEQEDSE